MSSDVRQRVVRLIAMGGTIAFDSTANGAVPRLDGHDLSTWITADDLSIQPVDVAQISSIGLRDEHLLTLAETVTAAARDGCAGVVITHGTDTLEETAYFLALTCPRGELPVVLTAAMRHNGMPGPDGPANLRAALITATTPGVAKAGPVVVMADEIHAARFITKIHGTRLAAFASPLSGPIGQIVEDYATIWFNPRYDDQIGRPVGSTLPRVDLMKTVIGMTPSALRAVVKTAPDGLVIEGFGGGHVPPDLLDVIDEAITAGIPTVIASRCGDGPTLQTTYAVPGAEIDLQARGAIMAGSLSAVKARLRLAVALATDTPLTTAFPVR
jgi:L-asparaginase